MLILDLDGLIEQAEFIFKYTTNSSVFVYQGIVCLSINRIDMHIQLHDQSLIAQRSIGLDFKVVKKMDGQLFNSDALLIPVIQWMFPSKFVFRLVSTNDDIVCEVVYRLVQIF